MQPGGSRKSKIASTMVGAFVGAALGTAIVQWLFHFLRKRLVLRVDALSATRSPQDREPQTSSAPCTSEAIPEAKTVGELEESAWRLVPEVYLGVATVIQGITIGVLGQAIVKYGLKSPVDWLTWIMILSSFMVALIYWLAFVEGYLYLYRIVRLRAGDHLICTAAYFGMGVSQIVGYSLVHIPIAWLVSVAVMVLMAAGYSAFLVHVLKRRPASREPIAGQIQTDHRRLSWVLSFTFIVLVALIWLVSKWPLVVLAIPLISAVLLWDLVREFRRRQCIAHGSGRSGTE